MAKNLIELIIEAKDRTGAVLDKQEGKLGKLWSVLKSGPVVAGAAIAAVVASIGAMVSKTAEWGDTLLDASKRTGVSVESLSTLAYAAEQTGSSFEGMQVGLKGLAARASDAAAGNEKLTGAFAKVGVSVLDSTGKMKSQEQLLMELSDGFKAMPNGVEKAALAQELFGKSGLELIPILNEGSDGIADMQARARELGIEFSTDLAGKSDAFKDSQNDVKKAMQGLSIEISTVFMPIATKLLNWFVDGLIWLRKFGETYGEVTRKMDDITGEVFAAIIEKAAWLADNFLAYYQKIAGAIDWAGEKTHLWESGFSEDIQGARDSLKGLADGAAAGMRKWGEKTEEETKGTIVPALDEIGTEAERTAARTKGALGEVSEAFDEASIKIIDHKEKAKQAEEENRRLAESMGDVSESVLGVRDPMDAVRDSLERETAGARDAKDATKGFGDEAKRTAAGSVTDLIFSLGDLFDHLNMTGTGFEKLIGWIGKLNSVAGSLGKIFNSVTNLLGGGGGGVTGAAGGASGLGSLVSGVKGLAGLASKAGGIASSGGSAIGSGASAVAPFLAPAAYIAGAGYGIGQVFGAIAGQNWGSAAMTYQERLAEEESQALRASRIAQAGVSNANRGGGYAGYTPGMSVGYDPNNLALRPSSAYMQRNVPSVVINNYGGLMGSEADASRFIRKIQSGIAGQTDLEIHA
jgi:hypothetical protein